MVSFLIIALINYFLIIGAKANNLSIVKFTSKSKIYLIIVIALKNFFNISTIGRCFFFSIVFFSLLAFLFNIVTF